MKMLSVLAILLITASALASSPALPRSIEGEYDGYDAYWLHPHSAKFRVSLNGGAISISSSNISQAAGCDARVGRLISSKFVDQKYHFVFELSKSSNCRIESKTIQFTFDSNESGCSEWSAQIRAKFFAYQYRGGRRHNLPTSQNVHWGLVKPGACSSN